MQESRKLEVFPWKCFNIRKTDNSVQQGAWEIDWMPLESPYQVSNLHQKKPNKRIDTHKVLKSEKALGKH